MDLKPSGCIHPMCASCPLPDCGWSQMTISEYLAQNRRDHEAEEHKHRPYKQRSHASDGRKQYMREYYRQNRDERIRKAREYQKRTGWKSKADRKEYFRKYYAEHKEESKERSEKRIREIKESLNATG